MTAVTIAPVRAPVYWGSHAVGDAKLSAPHYSAIETTAVRPRILASKSRPWQAGPRAVVAGTMEPRHGTAFLPTT